MARNQKQQREASEFEERVVYINRVSKTVKGGRRMSLVALVVVGSRRLMLHMLFGADPSTFARIYTAKDAA